MYLGHALLFPTQYNFENQEKFQVPVFNTVYGEGVEVRQVKCQFLY